MRLLPELVGRVLAFDETGSDGFHRSWIMLFPVGEYQHEQYGELDFTRAKLAHIKNLFDQRVRHIDVALDADHRAAREDSRATGWVEALELREAQPDGTPAGLWGRIKWTPYGLMYLRADEYRYFSPEFGPWTDPETGKEYDDVLLGGALTNRPFLKKMPAIALSERAGARGRGGRRGAAGVEAEGTRTVGKTTNGVTATLSDEERELAELERELAELRLLADGRKSAKKKPMQPPQEDDGDDDAGDEADGSGDEGEELAEELDDADGDGPTVAMADPDDDGDEDAGGEQPDDDEDMMPPMPKRRGRGAKAAEWPSGDVSALADQSRVLSLAEQRELQQRLAEANFKLYESAVEAQLESWKRGSFSFSENGQAAKAGRTKRGRIALAKSFCDAYRAFMRTEGIALSETRRVKLNAIIESALSTAIVDLSQRGGSYDPEGRMAPAPRVSTGDADAMQRAAETIALREHNTSNIATLAEATQLDIYTRAAKQVNY